MTACDERTSACGVTPTNTSARGATFDGIRTGCSASGTVCGADRSPQRKRWRLPGARDVDGPLPSPRTGGRAAADVPTAGRVRTAGDTSAGSGRGEWTRSTPSGIRVPGVRRAVAVGRVATQYQEDLPAVRPVVRRFDIEVSYCAPCRRVQGLHALQTSDAVGAASVQLGPGVVALVVEIYTHLGVPVAKVAHLLRTEFGLTVTAGRLAHVLHRAAGAAAPAARRSASRSATRR